MSYDQEKNVEYNRHFSIQIWQNYHIVSYVRVTDVTSDCVIF